MAVNIEDFNDGVMRKLFPQAWAKVRGVIPHVNLQALPVPVKEKVSDLKEPEASTPELFSLQEDPLQEQEASTPIDGNGVANPDPLQSGHKEMTLSNTEGHSGKPATAQPRAGVKHFDFESHIKDYEERRLKGLEGMKRILLVLTDEQAQDYVKLYFASVSVMWDVDKFRQRIKEDIAVWTSLREKYGDGKITNYSRSIETGKLILEALKNANY